MADDKVNKWFGELEKLLARNPLPTESGTPRIAQVDEFMFMNEEKGTVFFKHRHTRNYILLTSDMFGNRVLRIPSGEAFMRGFFDDLATPLKAM